MLFFRKQNIVPGTKIINRWFYLFLIIYLTKLVYNNYLFRTKYLVKANQKYNIQ